MNMDGVSGTFTGNPGYRVYTQPSQPSGNAGDIWIKTSSSISNIVFEPNPYITEEPHFSSTTLSVINAFSDYSNLKTVTVTDIHNSMIKKKIPYPVIARYGTTSAGLSMYNAYLYNGSTWVQISPSLILYAYGYDPYDFGFKGTYTTGNGTMSKNDTHIYGRAYYGKTGNSAWWSVGPETSIDITNYTKLKALVQNKTNNQYYTMGIGIADSSLKRLSSAVSTVFSAPTQDIVELSLDLSSYTGSYYIMTGMTGNYSTDLIGNVFAVWLE